MLSRSLLPWLMATAATCIVSAQNPSWDNSTQSPFTPITLNATDGSVSAVFIPYGATVTHLFVKDKGGVTRDLVLGYEDPVSCPTFAHERNRLTHRLYVFLRLPTRLILPIPILAP